jgi:tripartite-type tricarboxylate transporter receptor subunit TctC
MLSGQLSNNSNNAVSDHPEENCMLARLLSIVCAVLLATAVHAQESPGSYPTKTVKIVVGFPPGQATDIVARILAEKMTAKWGQPFVVENKPGAAAIIATELAAKAAPDGYTLLMSSSGPLAVNPSLYSKLPYDPVNDLQPIALATKVPLFLVVYPGAPFKSLQELIAQAKANPGKINYASGGSGVTNHLAMEMLKTMAGINLTHVPYKGGPPAVSDLIAGHVTIMFETGPAVLPHVSAGKLRAIAAGGATRSAAVPQLPTVAEQGVAGFDAVAWIGLVGPAGMPQAIVQKLNAETAAILALPEVRERLLTLGAEPAAGSVEEFRAYMKAEMAKWGKAVRDSGAKAD